MSHPTETCHVVRKVPAILVRTVAVVVAMLLVATAAPASASVVKTRIMERDGEILMVSNTVGNQALPAQWVEHDDRRHGEDGLTLYYAIDQTELPPDIPWEDTEAAIESAIATFNQVQCARNLRLERAPSDPDADLGYAQDAVDLGGDPNPRPDITFAGWVPPEFFARAGMDGSLGLTVPVLFGAPDDELVWGFDILNPTREYADINADGNADLYAMEVYFTTDPRFDYVVDNNEDELFSIDVESIVLHELGHALGMDHFGRYTTVLDENGEFVDLIVDPNSVNLMNTANYFAKRDLSGSDVGSFCGIYATWGKGARGAQ